MPMSASNSTAVVSRPHCYLNQLTRALQTNSSTTCFTTGRDATASSKSMSQQSCDQCHARRKRCDRAWPCALCIKSELRCTYAKRLKKRGPKGKVIERLRHEQAEVEEVGAEEELALAREVYATRVVSYSSPSRDPGVINMSSPADLDISSLKTSTSSTLNLDLSALLLPLPSHLPPSFAAYDSTFLGGLSVGNINALVAKYFDHIHPCYPLVDREWFLDRLHSGEPFLDSDSVFATMVLSICALTMAFISNVLCLDKSAVFKARRDAITSQIILRHYMQPLGDATTLEQVITTFLLGLYFSIVFGDRAGHFRIAEAAHLAKSLGLHRRSTYTGMGTDERRRSLAVFSCVVPSNRACELRLGLSEIIHIGRDSLLVELGDPVDLVDAPCTLFGLNERTDGVHHLARMVALYDIVSPNFSRCARDQCDLETCRLDPFVIIKYANKLEEAASTMPISMFRAMQPLLCGLQEMRWIEFFIAHRWLAAHTWHIAMRHSIDMAKLEGGRYQQWPLNIVSDAAQIITAANTQSMHVLGTGLVHRLSYISACGVTYLQTNPADMHTVSRASADLQIISDAVRDWDSKCWTRCLF